MSITPSPEESREMLKWLNRNRDRLKKQYAHQYVAYNANRIIANGESLDEVLDLAEASRELFLIYLVPEYTGCVQFVGVRFR
ncbi:DUF5678 domain-containing protein [Aerosakkonema funiforme]|uniref:DUF5678 domain-containing protein n=1 Tax=Aerosakkonema funiforme TaxID=1246630 RepID=UPI0035B7B456